MSKQVPPEAGLGGGSANAATALFAANELAGRPASSEDLQLWSGEVGSDITFFLSSGTCYCTGRGEILHPQQAMPQARSGFGRFGYMATLQGRQRQSKRFPSGHHPSGHHPSSKVYVTFQDRQAVFVVRRSGLGICSKLVAHSSLPFCSPTLGRL